MLVSTSSVQRSKLVAPDNERNSGTKRVQRESCAVTSGRSCHSGLGPRSQCGALVHARPVPVPCARQRTNPRLKGFVPAADLPKGCTVIAVLGHPGSLWSAAAAARGTTTTSSREWS
jgi:hypothetical protein